MTELTQHPQDLLPELALGVLAEGDAAEVREHLDACDSCRAEFAEMERVARLLPLANDDVRLSPAVREGVMTRIGREPRRAASKPKWRWRPLAMAAGVALLIGAGIGIGFGIGNGGGNSSGTSGRDSALMTALLNGSAETSQVQSGDLSMRFVHAPGATEGYVSGQGLPPLPVGKAYEAWFTKDGTHMEPATVFTSGSGAWIEAPGPIGQYVAVGFTVEKASGAKAPSTQPFAVVPLTHSGESAS